MKYIITEEQYDRVVNKTVLFWIRRRYDLVEKASRLMNTNAAGQQTQKPKPVQNNSSILDIETIRNVVKETVEDILRENGLLTESESKTNELLTFKVGKHIFEGKVTKIKKIR